MQAEETRLQDDAQPQVFYGYCALRNLGYSAANPPEDIDAVLQGVVRDWVTLWTGSLYQAGIPRDRIFTHNGTPTEPPGGVGNPLRRFYKNADPGVTAFTDFSYPGFSVHTGKADTFAELRRKFGQRLGNSWGIAEGTVVSLGDPFRGGLGGSSLAPEQYLAAAYDGGAVFVDIFGWGDGNDRFSGPARSPAAIAAYRKFLRGERLAAALSPTPVAASAPSPAAASSRELFLAKITKIQHQAPAWADANPARGPELGTLIQQLDGFMRTDDLASASRTADQILELIAQRR